MYETVVIGWDGGAASEEAVRWALHGPHADRYRLLHVVDGRRLKEGDPPPHDAESAAAASLRRRLRQVDGTVDRLHGELAVGRPEDELVRATGAASLLVLGTDRSATRTTRRPSNLASRVTARAHGPVVVVPPGCADRTGGIVVGVDGTAASRTAAFRAAELADELGRPLTVVHAWHAQDDRAASQEEAHRGLLDVVVAAVRARHPDLPLATSLVQGSSRAALLAASADAALVVLGRHGRPVAPRPLLGSVARTMLLSGAVPVLVTGPEGAPAPADPLRDAGQPRSSSSSSSPRAAR